MKNEPSILEEVFSPPTVTRAWGFFSVEVVFFDSECKICFFLSSTSVESKDLRRKRWLAALPSLALVDR